MLLRLLKADIPQVNRRIRAGACQQSPVRVERNTRDPAVLSANGQANSSAGRYVPQNDRFIAAARRQNTPIRTESKAEYPVCVAAQLPDRLVGCYIPQPDRPVPAA